MILATYKSGAHPGAQGLARYAMPGALPGGRYRAASGTARAPVRQPAAERSGCRLPRGYRAAPLAMPAVEASTPGWVSRRSARAGTPSIVAANLAGTIP